MPGSRPAGRSARIASSAALRSISPGATQSPSRSGANPSQVSVERRRLRRLRRSSGNEKVTNVHCAERRVEGVRIAHPCGGLPQHRDARRRGREDDLPPAALSRDQTALLDAVESRSRRGSGDARRLEHFDERARRNRARVAVDHELAEQREKQLP